MNRDDGLRRIRTVTGWTLAGTVGAAGVFAGLAAHAHPGATTAKKSSASTATTPTTTSGSQSSDSQSSDDSGSSSSSQSTSQLQPTTVLPSTSANTPTVVSGAS